jgi:hypothetical protein
MRFKQPDYFGAWFPSVLLLRVSAVAQERA